jgi:cytochrome c556
MEVALCAVLFAGVAGASLAQGGAADVIAKRSAAMKGFGASGAAINAAAGTGDFATANAKAKDLAATVHALPTLFPAGSGPGAGTPTRAKAEIWTDMAGFKAAADKAATAADGIVAATDAKNADQIKDAVRAFQGTCGGCHTPYRAAAAA